MEKDKLYYYEYRGKPLTHHLALLEVKELLAGVIKHRYAKYRRENLGILTTVVNQIYGDNISNETFQKYQQLLESLTTELRNVELEDPERAQRSIKCRLRELRKALAPEALPESTRASELKKQIAEHEEGYAQTIKPTRTKAQIMYDIEQQLGDARPGLTPKFPVATEAYAKFDKNKEKITQDNLEHIIPVLQEESGFETRMLAPKEIEIQHNGTRLLRIDTDIQHSGCHGNIFALYDNKGSELRCQSHPVSLEGKLIRALQNLSWLYLGHKIII